MTQPGEPQTIRFEAKLTAAEHREIRRTADDYLHSLHGNDFTEKERTATEYLLVAAASILRQIHVQDITHPALMGFFLSLPEACPDVAKGPWIEIRDFAFLVNDANDVSVRLLPEVSELPRDQVPDPLAVVFRHNFGRLSLSVQRALTEEAPPAAVGEPPASEPHSPSPALDEPTAADPPPAPSPDPAAPPE